MEWLDEPHNISYGVIKHTEETRKLYVKENGLKLRFISHINQTEEICKIAVQQNGLALLFVVNPTEKIIK